MSDPSSSTETGPSTESGLSSGRGTAWAELEPQRISDALGDLGLEPAQVAPGAPGRRALLLALETGRGAGSAEADEAARRGAELAAHDGALLLFLDGGRSDEELAALRNALWPVFHVVALYVLEPGGTTRRNLQGTTALEGRPPRESVPPTGVLVVARRREHVMSPDFTVEKFDQNAAGWNGRPGTPGYPHFRWMRRFVGCFAEGRADARILDFGCGAGWVGVEAAECYGARELCFFDPSPEMVRIAEENARSAGVARFTGRTGFGEEPPFPAAGEEPFELVISSGVVSFSPDLERWLDGLTSTVAPGGELVIGDIDARSRGFRRRRAQRPLLPVRELNAYERGAVRARLEARGFEHRGSAGYQLTRPVPELMHVNETRLHGALTRPLLWGNQLATAVLGARGEGCFDSWVMRFRRR